MRIRLERHSLLQQTSMPIIHHVLSSSEENRLIALAQMQVGRLGSFAYPIRLRDYVMLQTALGTGFTAPDIAMLACESYTVTNLEDMTIESLSIEVQHTRRRMSVIIGEGLGGLLSEYMCMKTEFGESISDEAPLFVSYRSHSALHPHTVMSAIQRLMTAAGTVCPSIMTLKRTYIQRIYTAATDAAVFNWQVAHVYKPKQWGPCVSRKDCVALLGQVDSVRPKWFYDLPREEGRRTIERASTATLAGEYDEAGESHAREGGREITRRTI